MIVTDDELRIARHADAVIHMHAERFFVRGHNSQFGAGDHRFSDLHAIEISFRVLGVRTAGPHATVPIYLAAGGDSMLDLAAAQTDGVFTFLRGEQLTKSAARRLGLWCWWPSQLDRWAQPQADDDVAEQCMDIAR